MIRKKPHRWWASGSDGPWQPPLNELDMPLTPQAAALEQSSRNFLTRMCSRCVLKTARRRRCRQVLSLIRVRRRYAVSDTGQGSKQ